MKIKISYINLLLSLFFFTHFALLAEETIPPASDVTPTIDMVKILLKGNPKEFETGITNGGDINSTDESGKSLLILAVEKNRPKQKRGERTP